MSLLNKKNIRIRVAGLLIENGSLLMVCHKKNNRSYWLLPGGGVEYGETLQEALAREFEEELGIIVEPKDLLFSIDSIAPSGKRHIVNLVFSCSYLSGTYRLGSDKRLFDFKFLSLAELSDVTIYPSFKKQLIEYITGADNKRVYLGSHWKK
ncbi:MAG: NUDIX domain-containing protein [Spirochaetes bacterium]|nr:NUDIX domain-containing protein [Spirochaetota bacterium]